MNVEEIVLPILILSIPLAAVIGSFIHGILKSLGQQRFLELAQRERMMAIERGIPPENLPPLRTSHSTGDVGLTFEQQQLRRSQGLMIGGLISVAVGAGMVAFLMQIPDAARQNAWAVGFVPMFVGFACIIAAWIVRPKGGDGHGTTPRSGV